MTSCIQQCYIIKLYAGKDGLWAMLLMRSSSPVGLNWYRFWRNNESDSNFLKILLFFLKIISIWLVKNYVGSRTPPTLVNLPGDLDMIFSGEKNPGCSKSDQILSRIFRISIYLIGADRELSLTTIDQTETQIYVLYTSLYVTFSLVN